MPGAAEGEQAVASAYRRTGLTVRDAWLRYLALGGNADEVSVDAQLHGLAVLSPGEHNVLAHALNEELDDLADPGPRVPPAPLGEGLRRSGA
ncbi:hypothetical protein ACI797_10055 [Geodermatophilus sp. SYSU D00691]